MAYYKILKSGYFSEEFLNKVGDVVALDENAAGAAVEKGFLEVSKKEVKPEKIEVKKKIKKKKGVKS